MQIFFDPEFNFFLKYINLLKNIFYFYYFLLKKKIFIYKYKNILKKNIYAL